MSFHFTFYILLFSLKRRRFLEEKKNQIISQALEVNHFGSRQYHFFRLFYTYLNGINITKSIDYIVIESNDRFRFIFCLKKKEREFKEKMKWNEIFIEIAFLTEKSRILSSKLKFSLKFKRNEWMNVQI